MSVNGKMYLNQLTCQGTFRSVCFMFLWGWSGGAMVLGKLPVPGRPTYLE